MAVGLILSAFRRALGQLGDRRFLRVLLLGVVLALVLLLGAGGALLWLVAAALGPETTLPLLGPVSWFDDLLSGASLVVIVLLSAVLMVPVASAMTGLFLDDVARAVEARHYPELPPASPPGFLAGLRDTLGFLAVMLGANLLALVLYLAFAPFALVIFWGLNGFLLGREYFTLAASRRLGRAEAIALRRRHAGTIWLAGLLMAAPLSLPLVNLFIPVLGAATFTHIVNGCQRPACP
ncbi:EI24 domain-containing protein [uncultured Lentibacter sp.]|uniref:EI24 domain-containing protein n=1 Tax=uncultured Lentibacter sp. TaxID=1659309 RepID=UPI002610D56E|nr:EI24 domain-containing protein [uncultured Lentibacter sp.]